MEDLTGKQLGQYQLVAPLGEGGMAVVYKAYQPSMERYVALKILPRQYAADPTFLQRFQQEARIIASLEHPGILPVYDYGQADGYTYIVMRFVQGHTLADLLQGEPLPPSQIAEIMGKIAAALDHAHTRGVVHRDVKPSNVLIDQNGNLLLTDFGVAKMLLASAKLTASGAFIGTPTYASPEQCLGIQDIDRRSDVYSLGAILYEMATGRPPFHAETPMAIVIKHIHDPLPLPRSLNPALPESVERVILKALAKQPEGRYQTAGEMAKALEAALAEPGTETGTIVPPMPVPPTPISAKRRPIPAWGWALGCLAIISIVAALTGVAIWAWMTLRSTPTTPTAMAAIRTTATTPSPSAAIAPTTEAVPLQVQPSATWTAPLPTASPAPPPRGTPTPTAGAVTPTSSILPEASEGQPHPAIAIGPDSKIHLVWADTSSGDWNVRYSYSTDGSATFHQPVPVGAQAGGAMREHPALAVDPHGRIHIAWEEGRDGSRDITYAYSDNGETFSPPMRVSDDATQADQARPALAVGRDGTVYLAWQDNRNGDWDVYSARLANGSDTFGPNQRVNVETRGPQVDPAIGVDSQGRVHVVWADDQSGTRRVYYAHSEGETFSRGRVVGSGLMADLSDEVPSLAVGPDDTVHVAWANAYVMHPTYGVPLYLPVYAVSTNRGDTFSDPRQVGDGYRYVSVRPPETSVAADHTVVHVVLTTYSPRDGSWVWYYRSADGGKSFSAGVGVGQAQGGDVLHYPVVAAGQEGRIHVAWAHQRANEWDVYYSQSNDGGATFSAGVKVGRE